MTLLTDFGEADGYVGQMKGALLGICPDARLVDLSHAVPPQAIAAGAFLLESASAAFPKETIHLAVVDPGVGTRRRPLVVRTERHTFVLPDNGLVSRVLDRDGLRGAWALEAGPYRQAPVSPTFEGRDLFAPAAAWLARGLAPEELGVPVTDPVRLPVGPRVLARGETAVPVLWIDRFGNVVLDLPQSLLEPHLGSGGGVRVRAAGADVERFARTYGEAPGGEPFLLFGSAGYLEIAVPGGRADAALGLRVGDTATVVL